ncbi:MAG: hypothetical protein OK422_03760 [Thaumarchaeota archaeon]|nr:hypothetical protein [Nitrososphaerota archaeon]
MIDKKGTHVAKSMVRSISRVAEDRGHVGTTLAQKDVKSSLEQLVRPRSLAGGMKKAGVALLLAPDPITDVAGIALLASAYVAKDRDPASVKNVVHEARKLLRDMESLNL